MSKVFASSTTNFLAKTSRGDSMFVHTLPFLPGSDTYYSERCRDLATEGPPDGSNESFSLLCCYLELCNHFASEKEDLLSGRAGSEASPVRRAPSDGLRVLT